MNIFIYLFIQKSPEKKKIYLITFENQSREGQLPSSASANLNLE